ncbi:MAG: hypothetical protein ISS65_09065 [Desulfobacterales bacterium]|uniref:Lipoprotein n=1 Tax=Candidatus Desulfatibia profunda TaxID=2841695 RepID=A0A8J6NVL8_9BACT|nr:hypothetical protein [Candidatus Desulfatibia profunda]MBL7180342.1 hypothetical protein [Desulfobacterales bacterium]
MNKYIFKTLVIFLALLICGCTSWVKGYGKIRYMRGEKDAVTIQDLINNWQDYDIYYAGLDVRLPLGIMFDPKNNTTALAGRWWKKVEDQKTLIEITEWIYPHTRYYPELSKILGPDDQFYGYLYHSYGFVFLKLIDDNKMYVYDLEDPNDRGEGSDSF